MYEANVVARTRSDADMELPPFFSIGKDTRHARTTHTFIIIIIVYHIRVWPIPNKEKSGRRRGVNDVRPKTGLSRRGSVAVVGPFIVVTLCAAVAAIRTTLRDLENSAPARVFARQRRRDDRLWRRCFDLVAETYFVLPAPVFSHFFFASFPPPRCFFFTSKFQSSTRSFICFHTCLTRT